MQNKSKINTVLSVVIIILLIIVLAYLFYSNVKNKNDYLNNAYQYIQQQDNQNLNKDNSNLGKEQKFVNTNKNRTAKAGEPFVLSVGESIDVPNHITLTFLKTVKENNCGSDVQVCPDSVRIDVHNNTTGKTTEISLYNKFYDYKIAGVDIMITKQIDVDTYEFKVSPIFFD